MSEDLQKIHQELYSSFAHYTSGPGMDRSPLYEGRIKAMNKELFGKPMPELEPDDLVLYCGKAITTWGGATDYKHFLPRILELSAQFRTPYEFWLVFDRMQMAEFETWPQEEQDLIHQWMLALWKELLAYDGSLADSHFRDYFPALAHFYPNFEELLNVWQDFKTPAYALHLANFLYDEQVAIFDRGKIPGFEDQSKNAAAFKTWLLSDRVYEGITSAFFKASLPGDLDKLSIAEQILDQRRKFG